MWKIMYWQMKDPRAISCEHWIEKLGNGETITERQRNSLAARGFPLELDVVNGWTSKPRFMVKDPSTRLCLRVFLRCAKNKRAVDEWCTGE